MEKEIHGIKNSDDRESTFKKHRARLAKKDQ